MRSILVAVSVLPDTVSTWSLDMSHAETGVSTLRLCLLHLKNAEENADREEALHHLALCTASVQHISHMVLSKQRASKRSCAAIEPPCLHTTAQPHNCC